MEVYDAFILMLLSFKEADGIVVSRYPEYFALEGVLQSCEAGLHLCSHRLLIVGAVFVVAVGDVTSNQAVVEMVLAG